MNDKYLLDYKQKEEYSFWLTLSLPARSTKWNFEVVITQSPSSPEAAAAGFWAPRRLPGRLSLLLPDGAHFSCFKVTDKMAWDLDDFSFISVAPVARLRVPC